MENQPVPVLAPRDVLRILRRHGKKAGLFALGTVCVIAIYLVTTPKTYQSTAKLFFRVGRETIGLDPTATTSDIVQVRASRVEEIKSALEMLKSRTVLEKVVDVLGPRKILEKPQQKNSLFKALSLKGLFAAKGGSAAGDRPDAGLDRRRAIKSLGNSLDFDAPKETTVIVITCKAASPETAQSIVAAVVDSYTEEHMRLNRTAGSMEFFAEQAELVHQQLGEKVQELTVAKNERATVSVEADLKSLQVRMSENQADRLRTERELAVSEARCQALKESLAGMDEMIVTQRVEGIANRATDAMRSQLYDLEAREAELRNKYTASHPLVIAITGQVAELRKILEAESKIEPQATVGANPAYLQLHVSLLNEQVNLASAKKAMEELMRQRETLAQAIRDLNIDALHIEELQGRVTLLATNYQTYSENLEQARIDDAVRQQRISNVNVIQQATLEGQDVGPQRKLLAAMGLFVAVFGGTALAFLFEYFDPRLSSPQEVEHVLELPVLISIPRSAQQCVNV